MKNEVKKFPILRGAYLGQKPPGITPKVFAPGIISTGYSEACLVFAPDGKELFYVMQGAPYGVILTMKQKNNKWSKPHIVSFSGKYSDGELSLSPDGNKLSFISLRPFERKGEPIEYWDIWIVERNKKGWDEPKNLGPIINSDKMEAFPVLAQNGNLYFSSDRESGKGGWDIYCSEYINGNYTAPKSLKKSINTKYDEWDAFIAPDESYIIFGSKDREDGYGESDLYISFRNEDGSWSQAENMGEDINSNAGEYYPIVTPDGKYFFFNSVKRLYQSCSEKPITYEEKIKILSKPGNGSADIYWVDARIINNLKPKELK